LLAGINAKEKYFMGIKKVVQEKAQNEFEFEKVKGFGAYNFVWHNTKVLVEDTCLSIEHRRKIMFFKGKPDNTVVSYSDLERIELKSQFSKGDLISGIIIAIIAILTVQLYGLLFTVILVLFSYSKNIVIVLKNGLKKTIPNGGLLSGGGQAEFDKMISVLTTKIGRQIYIKN
jgi:hypothetical protein